jgi:peptide/nickel transport system substrate-binding protein
VPDAALAKAFLAPALKKPLYPYDPAAGLKLLEGHGWHLVNGVLTKGSQKMSFTLTYLSGNLSTTEQIELMQADWAKEGIKVTLESAPLTSLLGTLANKPKAWEMVGGITYSFEGYPSGESLYYKDEGLDSWYGWNNAEENSLINATLAPSASPAQTQANFFKYETYTAKELPMLFSGFPEHEKEIATNLQGAAASTFEPFLIIEPQYWSIAPTM